MAFDGVQQRYATYGLLRGEFVGMRWRGLTCLSCCRVLERDQGNARRYIDQQGEEGRHYRRRRLERPSRYHRVHEAVRQEILSPTPFQELLFGLRSGWTTRNQGDV
jgi:hypothetical protein